MSKFFGKKDKEKEGEKPAKTEDEGQAKKADEVADQNPDNVQVNPDDKEKGMEVCQMKRGDYMIHVYVEQAKNLKVDAEDTVDPLVEVKLLGLKKFTTACDDINNTGVAVWNEHLFFELKNQEVDTLEKAQVEIKLMDKGYFKDALIGYYQFDLSFLYNQKDHCMMHKWIIMSNPESDDYGEVTGQLKMSITITGTGDEQVGIEEDPNPEKESIFQPPQVKPKFYQLKFRFFAAQKIVPLDKNVVGANSTDAFVKLEYKTSKLKSKIQKIEEGGEIFWNQEFLVPAQIPIIGGRLVFKVLDDDLTGDELIGGINYAIKDIVPDAKGKPGRLQGRFDWKNIYGAPLSVSGPNADNMNQTPELASFWKGRCLVQCVAEETEKPLLLVRDITDEDLLEKMKEYLRPRKYKIAIMFKCLLAMPKEKEEYWITVRIADKEWSSGKHKGTAKKRYLRFDSRPTDEDNTITMPYSSIEDIGTVFVYLNQKFTIGKDKRVAYWKGSIMEFAKPKADLRWIEMNPDLAVGEVKEHYKSGIVGLLMSIHDLERNGPIDFNEYDPWSKPPPKRAKIFKVRVFVWQARDLPAADDSGSSDPFVQIVDTDDCRETAVIWDNLNPLFYQGLDAIYDADSIENLPPIIVDVYDRDANLIGKDDNDFIARAVLSVQKLEYSTDDTIPEPKWYNLYFLTGGAVSGQILLSFAIVRDDYSFNKLENELRLEDQVEMNEYSVSMNILGLRGLQSAGILPVKKAFVQFNLKSLVAPNHGQNLENIRTEPKMGGSDPTLSTLIEFKCPLPVKDLFCPRLACGVFDNIAMGLSQPLIGNFTIPVGDLMRALLKERREETAALQQVVETLQKFVKGEFVTQSMRIIQKTKQDKAAKQMEEDLKKVQQQQREKDERASQLLLETGERQPTNYSINESARDLQEGLLSEDGNNDELKMQERDKIQQEALENPVKALPDEMIKSLQSQLLGLNVNELHSRANSRAASRAMSHLSARSKDSNGEPINKFDPKLKFHLLHQAAEQVDKARRDADELRKKAENEFKEAANIIMPQYELDELMNVDREIQVPPNALFIGLGYDEDRDTGRKHYRRYYPDELENVKEVLPIATPFNQYDLKRGQSRGAKVGFWKKITHQVKTDASGQATTEKVVGRFKAVIEVEAEDAKKAYFKNKHQLIDKLIELLKQLAKNREIRDFNLDLEKLETIEGRKEIKNMLEPLQVNHLNIVQKLADIQSDVILKKLLLQEEKCVVRVYMIEGVEFASRDIGGFSDPYLNLRLGNQKFSDRKNYILDEPNPKFCKHWNFTTTFPGCPMLFIDAMDYDDLFGDDLIGQTTVDLEDRYFLPEWRALHDKPVEYRQIYHPSSSVSQGLLKMWIEINPANVPPDQEVPVWDIRERPPIEMQMRVSVFDTREIKMMDAEGTSDVFIRAFFDSRHGALETDTHYRCQTGNASFNYRLNFKVTMPRKDYRFTVQAYDRDFFKSNDIIGSQIIDLKQAFLDVDLTKRPLLIKKDYYEKYMRKEGEEPLEFDKDQDSFWLPMLSKDKEGNIEKHGLVRIRIDITTMEYAEKNKVGSARDEPNNNPFLPPPIGRLHFSLNPCEMYKQLIGPEMRRKIAIWCCITISSVLCVMILYYLVPIVLGGLITKWIQNGF